MAKKKTAAAQEAEAQEMETASQETETVTEETVAPESTEPTAETPTDAPSALQTQYDDLNDRYLRLAAEYENFRKRSQREREQLHADAVTRAVNTLLPTYDNLERALKTETADAEYKKGVELTMTDLVDSLGKLGVTIIEAAPGTTFDPNLHNAVMHIENDEFGENVITEVFQQGFIVGERVIRHSMVQVAN